jgi:hypothetical protein
MAMPLKPDATSVGIQDTFSGNFTRALYLRSQPSLELDNRLGYAPGTLSQGWWLLFALEKPDPTNFEFGGYTYFSGGRIGMPKPGVERVRVEDDLAVTLGSSEAVARRKADHIANFLTLSGSDRLAKVRPVARPTDYPPGTGIYQCNIPRPILCVVAKFVGPGETYQGMYD